MLYPCKKKENYTAKNKENTAMTSKLKYYTEHYVSSTLYENNGCQIKFETFKFI